MDNITHTLVGVTLAQAFNRREPRPKVAKAVLWASVLASNVADLDSLLAQVSADPTLTYVLEHRGYTHTLVAGPVIGLLCAWAGARIGGISFKDHWARLLAVGLLGWALHVFADYWNSYGVHPFFPFWNHWLYGDFIFIMEPAIWFAMLPLAWFTARTKAGRSAWALIAAGMLAALWVGPYVAKSVAGAVTAWGLLVLVLQSRARARALVAAWALATVLFVFGISGLKTQAKVRDALTLGRENETVTDVAASPGPGNPLCWTIVAASRGGGDFIARVGSVSLAPEVFTAESCYLLRHPSADSILTPATFAESREIHWVGEFRRPLAEFERLKREDCRFAAFLHFARMPFWGLREGAPYAGDLRFGNGPRRGFSVIPLLRGQGVGPVCPQSVPPWGP